VPAYDLQHRADREDAVRSSPRRWLSLDVFRGLAVVWMIQGHTFTVLAHPFEIERIWGKWYELLHGLTAPMFLFGGGLAYGLATQPRQGAQASAARHVRRGLLLLALGYLIQLPRAPLREIAARPELFAIATAVGPLQLVGACLLLCEALRTLMRTRAAQLRAIAALCAAIAACAPLAWRARPSSSTMLLGNWLDGHAGSPFPLFPWAVFFLLGTLVSAPVAAALAPRVSSRRIRIRLGLFLIAGGLGAAALAFAMFAHGYRLRSLYGAYEFWHAGPLYVLFRAGAVIAWLGALSSAEPALAWLFARARAFSQLFGALAKQSLVAYVTHLLVLYGSVFTIGLNRLGKLELIEAGATFACVLLFTTAIAVLWEHYVTSGRSGAAVRGSVRRLLRAGGYEVHRVGERERRDVRTAEQRLESRPPARQRM
jgi:uncharacterized membrane protein